MASNFMVLEQVVGSSAPLDEFADTEVWRINYTGPKVPAARAVDDITARGGVAQVIEDRRSRSWWR